MREGDSHFHFHISLSLSQPPTCLHAPQTNHQPQSYLPNRILSHSHPSKLLKLYHEPPPKHSLISGTSLLFQIIPSKSALLRRSCASSIMPDGS